MPIKNNTTLQRLYCLFFCLGFALPLHAVEQAPVELQGWGGANLASKSAYTEALTEANYIQPIVGLTAWFAQPFVLPQNLAIGVSAAYMPLYTQTTGAGRVTSQTDFPLLLETRYKFPLDFFAAAGVGYAYTTLKINDETASANAALLSLKGGYQYKLWENFSAVITVQMLYALQSLTFSGKGDVANNQANFGLTLGIAYQFNR